VVSKLEKILSWLFHPMFGVKPSRMLGFIYDQIGLDFYPRLLYPIHRGAFMDATYVEMVNGSWQPIELEGSRLCLFQAFLDRAEGPLDVDVIGVTRQKSHWEFVGHCVFCGRLRKIDPHRAKAGTSCHCQKAGKRLATCKERYGDEFEAEIQRRSKNAMVERYGVESAFSLPEVRVKCQEAYSNNLDDIKAKVVATNMAKYGVESTLSLKSIREKQSETRFNNFVAALTLDSSDELIKIERHRTGHIAVVKCVLCGLERKLNQGHGCPCLAAEKARATCIDKYGVNSTNELDWKKEKAMATVRTRFGVDFASQNTEIKRRTITSHHNNMRNNRFRSKQEKEVADFVESLGLSHRKHASRDREIDIFIEEKMIGIEFNGTYWHSEAQGKGRSYHLNKTKIAAKEGIELIHIWSHVWETRRTQVESFLRAKLGKCSKKVGVRKCIVREITKDEAIKFVDSYHIQGANKRIDLAIGAFFNNELIAVSTFSPHHRGGPMKTLSRLCTKTDWVVSGFLGKAVRYGFAKLGPIVSWVDLGISNGKSYLAAGFKLDAKLPPDYAYIKGGGKIVKKQSFRKIDDRTERRRAKDEKLHRFWDCGKLRFIFDGK
jgi:hypothetical protein